jgi:hypothetical protein
LDDLHCGIRDWILLEFSCKIGVMADSSKHCAECEQILAEMRSAFTKQMSARPQGEVPRPEDFRQYLSHLSEADLARLRDLWQQSDSGVAYKKWMEHRIATGHVGVLLSAFN